MKFKINKLALIVSIAIVFLMSACSKPSSHYYLGGSGWNKIALVNGDGTTLWTHDLEKGQECNSVTTYPGGKLLYAFNQGAKLIDENHQTLWEYTCEKGAEVHAASLTDQGNILLGICGLPAKIIEFSPSGEKLVDISFETGIEKPHSQFRQISKNKEGNYLVPLLAKKSIYEIDANGTVLNEVKLDMSVFSLEVLASGNWLLSCGDSHKLIEIVPTTKEVVWELNENDVSGVPLRFVAEAKRLENGNTIICNWGGHSRDKAKSAQIFEIDRDNKLIWKIEDYQNFGNVSTMDVFIP